MLEFAIAGLLSLTPATPAVATEITARGSDSTISLVKSLAENYAKATGVTI